MKARELHNDDLKVTKGWMDSSNRIRVHVSLKGGASFVSKTYWLRENEIALPATLERIKKDLKEILQTKANTLKPYLMP